MQQTLTKAEAKPRPRGWLVILDYLYYILIVAFLVGFVYYFYSYRQYVAIDLPFLLQRGVTTTIFLSISSMILATIFGFIGALGRLSRFPPFRWIAFVYVEVVRGTPILVQLLLWAFGVSSVLSSIGFDPYNIAYQALTALQSNSILPDPLTVDSAFYGILALSFNYGAYLTEVFRTGIESVNTGQSEAALSLGLNSSQTMRRIILPQAFRITIPPFTNYFITLVQDTALLSVIGGVIELQQLTTSLASPLSSDPNAELFILIMGAVLFLCICYPLALLARYLESRMNIAY
jgi:polar amino acid transport system permease protein